MEELETGCKRDNSAPIRIFVHKGKNLDVLWTNYLSYQPGESGRVARTLELKEIEEDEHLEMWALNYGENLQAGSYGLLSFSFRARLSEEMRGLCFEDLAEPGGAPRRLLTSQFKPTGARLLFPLFDEPNFKATFNLTLVSALNDIALFNAPKNEVRYDFENDLKTTKFKTTPPMSAHTVAFVVGPMSYVERLSVGRKGIPVRVYTPRSLEEGLGLALEVASRSLEWMENYTGIDYGLPSYDIVVLLNQASDSAESWGLSFVRANVSLFDEATRPEWKIQVAINVAHVVAQQWFTNLITPKWWDSLWLTEGIAAHLAFEIVRDLYPEFQSDYFVRLFLLSRALESDLGTKDGLAKHPLSPHATQLRTHEQISELFDSLEFMKGASLCKFLQNNLGEMGYRQALRQLLRENAYGNVNLDDFVDAIRAGANREPPHIKIQLYKPSYPIIKVDLSKEQKLLLSQENMATIEFGMSVQFNSPNKTVLLPLPVCLCHSGVQPPKWFDSNNDDHWLKLNPNPDISTYYRVQYSDSMIQSSSFKKAIESKYMGPLDRLNILDDSVGLVLAGTMQLHIFKQLLGHYWNEDHGGVIMGLAAASKALRSLGIDDSVGSPLEKVFLNLYDRYGFTVSSGQSLIDLRAQMDSLSALVKMGNQRVIDDALKKFEENNGHIREINLREPVYEAVVAHGTSGLNELLFNHLEETESHEERMRLVNALSTSTNSTISERITEWRQRNKHKLR